MAKKKKLTKAEKAAKAKAYANKMTHGKAMDLYAFSGAGIRNTMMYMKYKDTGYFTRQIPIDYFGIDPEGTMPIEGSMPWLARGWGATVTRGAEKGVSSQDCQGGDRICPGLH